MYKECIYVNRNRLTCACIYAYIDSYLAASSASAYSMVAMLSAFGMYQYYKVTQT